MLNDDPVSTTLKGTLANRIRLEFNPSKLGADGIDELHGILSSIIPDGWTRFVKEAENHHLDVAIDLVGVRMTAGDGRRR